MVGDAHLTVHIVDSHQNSLTFNRVNSIIDIGLRHFAQPVLGLYLSGAARGYFPHAIIR